MAFHKIASRRGITFIASCLVFVLLGRATLGVVGPGQSHDAVGTVGGDQMTMPMPGQMHDGVGGNGMAVRVSRCQDGVCTLLHLVRQGAGLLAVPAAEAADGSVSIKNLSFMPSSLTISPGDSVTWTNMDPFTHTTTSNTGVWDSGFLGPSKSFTHTFLTAGTFPYHCSIHTFMTGTIVVQAQPTLIDSPTSGTVRKTVTVTGTNYGATESVKVFWDSSVSPAVTTTTSTASGSFVAKFLVPQAISGTHTIIATGQSSGTTANAPFRVLPNVLVSPTSGKAGSTAVLKGMGFGANETVQARWNARGGSLLGTTTTNGLGTFAAGSAITFTVPISSPGTYKVYGVGLSSGAHPSATFTISS